MRFAGLLLALTLLAPPATAATWIVDASGGGDFLTIQAAIDAAAPDDVIVVEPGVYGSFILDKDLAIVGDTKPGWPVTFAPGGKTVIATDNARIGGLKFVVLAIWHSDGVVVIEDCEVTGDSASIDGCAGSLQVSDCAQVHISRCVIGGRDGDEMCESVALNVHDAHVTVTESVLRGGDGWDVYHGRPALELRGASTVLLTGTPCTGGDGGSPLFGAPIAGDGAAALRIGWYDPPGLAACTVRGNSGDVLLGGLGGAGAVPGNDAAYVVDGNGTLVLSGVSYAPNSFDPALVTSFPAPAEPFIAFSGPDAPSSSRQLELTGPTGNAMLLLASFSPAMVTVFEADGPLYLDPFRTALVVPVPTAGQETPVIVPFAYPPSLVGLEGLLLVTQGFAPGLGANGAYLATNPGHLLIRR